MKPFIRIAKTMFVALLLLSAAGCGVVNSPVPTPDLLATMVAETLTAAAPPTGTPIPPEEPVPASTDVPAPTAQDVGTRYVYTQEGNVNLRINPGKLFPVSRVLTSGTQLEVLGIDPSGQWLNVRNNEGIVGWVGGLFVRGGFDGPPLPIVYPADMIMITGHVRDVDGNPISGIGLAFFQGGQRDDTSTDATGQYYFFLPRTLRGPWEIAQVSISCDSNIMDANCQCLGGSCGSLDPQSYILNFPLNAAITYDFTWK